MSRLLRAYTRNPIRTMAWAIGALVLLRLVVMFLSPLGLGPDEAQYWRWSQTLDWGYFSKPPLIAWVIHITSMLSDGPAPWAVRLFAPFGHGIAAFFLFLLARRIHGSETDRGNIAGLWAAGIYLLMPGVWLSSGIISTDGVLLPSWSAALYLLWRQREAPSLLQAALLGLAIGLAFLAKYAALYLIMGLVLTTVLDAPTRRALLRWQTLATIGVAAALITPNILWNAANDFATVSHTAENTQWENAGLNFGHLPKYILDQMAVFGPLSFIGLILGLGLVLPRARGSELAGDRWLLCFVLPALIAIGAQAVIARAHANWAATAYPAASVLVAIWVVRANWQKLVGAGLAINAIAGIILMAISVHPPVADGLGLSSAIRAARFWPETITELNKAREQVNANGIVFDEREHFHGFDYHAELTWGDKAPAAYLWRRKEGPHSFAEQIYPVPQNSEDVFLIASDREDFRLLMREDFALFEPVGELAIDLEGRRFRRFCLYKASGYAPVPRTLELETRLRGQVETCPTISDQP